jgi:hypothetical protein
VTEMVELVNPDGEQLTEEQIDCWHDWRLVFDAKYMTELECVLCAARRIERPRPGSGCEEAPMS